MKNFTLLILLCLLPLNNIEANLGGGPTGGEPAGPGQDGPGLGNGDAPGADPGTTDNGVGDVSGRDGGGGNNEWGGSNTGGSSGYRDYCPQTIDGLEEVYFTDELDEPQYFSWAEFNDSTSWPTVYPPLKYDQETYYQYLRQYGPSMYIHQGIAPVSPTEETTQLNLFDKQEAILILEDSEPGKYQLYAGENACWEFTIHPAELRSALEERQDENQDGLEDSSAGQAVANFLGNNKFARFAGKTISAVGSAGESVKDGLAELATSIASATNSTFGSIMGVFGLNEEGEMVYVDLGDVGNGTGTSPGGDASNSNSAIVRSDRLSDLTLTVSNVDVTGNDIIVQGYISNEGNAFAMLPANRGDELPLSLNIDYSCDGQIEVEKRITTKLLALATNGVKLPFAGSFAADNGGSHCLSVTVDSGNLIVESDETNNTSGSQTFAVDAAAVPNRDLAINDDIRDFQIASETESVQSENIDLLVRKVKLDDSDPSVPIQQRNYVGSTELQATELTISDGEDIALKYESRGFDRCVTSFFDAKGATSADTLALGINISEPNSGSSLRYTVRCYQGDAFEERFLVVTAQ